MMNKAAHTDRSGNPIGDGNFHASYNVIDFTAYPTVISSVSKSETTESVYVTYTNTDNDQSITCRFSNHENNAVKFGDQLNGYTAKENEILYRLGLKTRTFIPDTYLSVGCRQIKKIEVANYEIADLTIQEIYELGKDADISAFTGKVAKDSNWLILGSKVEQLEKTRLNCFGQEVRIGKFIYN